LLGNGSAIEELIDDHRDFGFGIEPFDEFVSGVAVTDAIVEFVPEFSREICDFAVTVLHIGFVVEFCVYERGPCRNGFLCKATSVRL
jgi:hypothetical protein